MPYMVIDTPSVARRHWEVFRKEQPPGDTLDIASAFADRIVAAIDRLQGRLGVQAPHVFCAFDSAPPTWRHELYDGYKRFRERPPHDYDVAIDLLRDALEPHGLVGYVDKMEADDLVASAVVATREQHPQEAVQVVSSDKDLSALITKGATLYNQAQREVVTAEAVKKRFGVEPHQMLDYLALVGDTSDNIPGVPRIGHKKASALLGQFNDLEAILGAGETDDRDVVAVQAHAEVARLSRQLTALRADLYRKQAAPGQPWPGKDSIHVFKRNRST